jgi:hypothetical protein
MSQQATTDVNLGYLRMETFEELCGLVADMFASSLSDMQKAQELLKRANGAPMHLLLAAALATARELHSERIDELENELEELKEELLR